MKFPLPLGHFYGYKSTDLRVHAPNTFAESEALRGWQHHLMLAWDPNLIPSGVYDGPTQRVVIEIQRVSGLNLTGRIDDDTWRAGLKRPVSPSESTESDEKAPGVPEVPTEASDASEGDAGLTPAPSVVQESVADTPEVTEAVTSDPPVTPAPPVKRGPGRPPKNSTHR